MNMNSELLKLSIYKSKNKVPYYSLTLASKEGAVAFPMKTIPM